MLSILVNGFQTTCILDTGSTFTLVPFKFWKQLQINQNKLNTAVHFNINSASRCNKDAVLGQIVLDLTISNVKGDTQLLKQNCLILRPELDLQLILLGNDFLYQNSVNISYTRSSVRTQIFINSESVPLLTGKIQAYFL